MERARKIKKDDELRIENFFVLEAEQTKRSDGRCVRAFVRVCVCACIHGCKYIPLVTRCRSLCSSLPDMVMPVDI